MCAMVFQGHPSHFKVTQAKQVNCVAAMKSFKFVSFLCVSVVKFPAKRMINIEGHFGHDLTRWPPGM